jgi:hypothetical protein
MFPSFPRYKEGTGGRGQIEPGPPVEQPERNHRLGRLIVLYILKARDILRKLEKRKARCVQCDFLMLTNIREVVTNFRCLI